MQQPINKGIIIMGSSRSDGDTAATVKTLSELTHFPTLDLKSLNFSDYDYQSGNLDDDFLPTVRKLVNNYEHIIWATPVYWYTMSALMKRFIDRISDCLRVEKDTGRKFRGMSMSMVSVSNDTRNSGFNEPFVLSAEYLGMSYLGDVHVIVSPDHPDSINQQLEPLLSFIAL